MEPVFTKPSEKPGLVHVYSVSILAGGRKVMSRPKNIRIFGTLLEKKKLPRFIGLVVEMWWAEFLGLDFLALR